MAHSWGTVIKIFESLGSSAAALARAGASRGSPRLPAISVASLKLDHALAVLPAFS